jgi:hypothetical protein
MVNTECPRCDEIIKVNKNMEVGTTINCFECGGGLVVVESGRRIILVEDYDGLEL